MTKKIEEFKPLNPPSVTFYTCGLTVYDYAHLGNMRTYTNNDLLKRTLNYLGYKVEHVMNITDVGHLTGDDDTGGDKLEKGAKKTGKSVWEVAQFYTDFFLNTLRELNIILPPKIPKATDHVEEMIEINKILEKKGFTYETQEALYFDIAKFKNYGQLSGQKLEDKRKGAREEVYLDPQKKNSADFALWFKRVGRFRDHTMHWDSPWGDGFPGWHIECSAMSMKYLGETIDLHLGGIDHIAVHHENEIAQSEAATDKQFVKHWFHNAFLLVNGEKMSKSKGNFYTIDDVKKQGIDPLAIRYLFLQTHYRQTMNFTWESAAAAQETYNKLKEYVLTIRNQKQRTVLSQEKMGQVDDFRQQFANAVSDDLQIPQAVAVMWSMLKSNIPSEDKLDLIYEFDQVFGLKLNLVEEAKIPDGIIKLAEEREKVRKLGDFKTSDLLRQKIQKKGFMIKDTNEGFIIKKQF